MYGLGYLGAALPVSFVINSPVQYVGKQPTYRISNATPGAQVYWSSYKDGKDTGEVRAAYGPNDGVLSAALALFDTQASNNHQPFLDLINEQNKDPHFSPVVNNIWRLLHQ
jgi:hypothetical protein